MAKTKKNCGLIINETIYKESASLVKVLTNEKIETFIVRGTKKSNSKTQKLVQLFNLLDYVVTDTHTINTITDATIINNYLSIRTDNDKTQVAIAILEKINTLENAISDYTILFEFTKNIFSLLEISKYPQSVLLIFDIKLWYLLGISPNFQMCQKCHNSLTEKNYFSVAYGGSICQNCSIQYDLDENQTNLLKFCYLIKLNKITEEFLALLNNEVDSIDEIIINYDNHYLDYQSKTKKIWKKIKKNSN